MAKGGGGGGGGGGGRQELCSVSFKRGRAAMTQDCPPHPPPKPNESQAQLSMLYCNHVTSKQFLVSVRIRTLFLSVSRVPTNASQRGHSH